jgi:hypothetical protein
LQYPPAQQRLTHRLGEQRPRPCEPLPAASWGGSFADLQSTFIAIVKGEKDASEWKTHS